MKNKFILLCYVLGIVSDRHVEAAQVTIFSFLPESDGALKTSSSVGFPSGNVCILPGSHKYYCVLCTLFFDRKNVTFSHQDEDMAEIFLKDIGLLTVCPF